MLSMASCNPTTYTQEPNRAISTGTYEVVNATNSIVNFYDVYYDEEYIIDPGETYYIDFNTNTNISVLTNIKFDGYCYYAADSEELVEIEWEAYSNPQWPWKCSIEAYGPSTGIGFYNKKPIPTDKDFYIDWQKFEPTNPTNTMDNVNILPNNSVWDFYKEDGSFYRANSNDVVLFRKKVEGSTVRATALGIKYSTNVYILVCANYIYPNITAFIPESIAQDAQKKLNTLSPTMFFYGGFTNKVRCHSGYYPFFPNERGYTDMEYITEFNSGYQGFGTNTQEDTFTALGKGIELMEMAINVGVMIFGFVIFPGITVGTLLMIPILVMLLLWLIRLIKRGG